VGDCWVEKAIVLSITASYTAVALSASLKVAGLITYDQIHKLNLSNSFVTFI